ncbi:DgyrCDS4890 [Dimorphilus gyrociliatus]|uniref:DgyrCDS4890 n=1 Tax=Dimorphilus gyrociliatus TaxID=2664684 RepID=A0A7I8VIU4_9ANNE|nr:DgyrCDS4890 [Dimorphilus gyrociliatus]
MSLNFDFVISLLPERDFDGQRRAERLFQVILVLFGVVGFIWGYICQQFSQTVYILIAGFVLSCILTLPPWPLYRRKPVKWLKIGAKERQAKTTETRQNKRRKGAALLASFTGVLAFRNRYRYHKTIQPLLNDKYVLITGCDTGIGRSAINKLSEAGFLVYAACLTTEAVNDIKKEFNDQVIPFVMDISKEESVQEGYQFVKSTMRDEKSLWAVINNAGILGKFCPFDWQNKEDYENTISVNFWGNFNVMKSFLPLLKKSNGRLITTTSATVLLPLPFTSSYLASKFALEGLVESTREEVEDFGVGVINVRPGLVWTDMTKTTKINWEKSWKSCPLEIKNQYGKEYYEEVLNNQPEVPDFLKTPPSSVADIYVRAATAKFPRATYFIGYDAYIYRFFSHFSPDNLIRSWFIKKLTLLKTKPKAAISNNEN